MNRFSRSRQHFAVWVLLAMVASGLGMATATLSGEDELPGVAASDADIANLKGLVIMKNCVSTGANCLGGTPSCKVGTDNQCLEPEAGCVAAPNCPTCTGQPNSSCSGPMPLMCQEVLIDCCFVQCECANTAGGCACMNLGRKRTIGKQLTC